MKNKYKNILKNNIPLIKNLSEKGFFSKDVRKQRIINYFFKKVFRVNSDVPWSVHFTSKVIIPQKIKIGKNVDRSFLLSTGCYFQAGNGIEIGDNTIFAPGTKIISANHSPSNLDEWEEEDSIVIGENCWLGANSIILPGVTIGDNVIVAAGAVVTKSFDSNITIGGCPAKIIKKSI